MCGIIGSIGLSLSTDEQHQLTDVLAHRGPDASGSYFDTNTKLFLGHRRLSIIDVSVSGNQPITSNDERYTIIFNGEIYNYQTLVQKIDDAGGTVDGESDTHVLLAGFSLWGMDFLEQIHGMFAFAIVDHQEQNLYVARDRFGVKPLYYTLQDDILVFSSEMKGIMSFGHTAKDIDPESLSDYFHYGYVIQPKTIFSHVFQLPPGSYAVMSLMKKPSVEPFVYYDPQQVLPQAYTYKTQEKAIAAVEEVLAQSIAYRLVSDVPVGVMLSGGVDSSVIAAIAKTQAPNIHTYTIGFTGNNAESEVDQARAVAEHLGTTHHERIVDNKDVLNSIPKIIDQLDEPFGDSSALPTYILSQWMSSTVTVGISGDGGDEMFGGYAKYWAIQKVRSFSTIKRMIVHLATMPMLRPITAFFVRRGGHMTNVHTKLAKLHAVTAGTTAEQQWDAAQTVWSKKEREALLVHSPQKKGKENKLPSADTVVMQMQVADMHQYLPSNILVKTDRMSMAVGLEAREPLLDQSLLETYTAIDPAIREKQDGKYLLKQILGSYIPKSLWDKPKTGFRPPIELWLQGPLYEQFLAVTSEDFITTQGLFAYDEIKKMLPKQEAFHTQSMDKWWTFFMFQLWYQRWMMPIDDK